MSQKYVAHKGVNTERVTSLGGAFAELILSLSDFLKGVEAPGMVALMIFLAAGVAAGYANWSLSRACALPRDLILLLHSSAQPITEVDLEGLQLPRSGGNYSFKSGRQARTWRSYCREFTFSNHGLGAASTAIAPSDALNRSTLGLRIAPWRIVPGTLVGVGLALTFLGLIAALREAGVAITASGDSPDAVKDALSGLLSIASAKFIMSLAGLVSSILFSIFLKAWELRLDNIVDELQAAVISRVRVIPPEAILGELLESSRRIETALGQSGR